MRNGMMPAVFAAVLVAACGGSRKGVDSTAAVQQQEANDGFSTGRVTTAFAGDGCPFLIRVEHADGLYLIPIAMDEKFKRDGLNLRFKYRPSRASSGDCKKGSPAVIEEVTVVGDQPRSQPKDQ